MRFPVSRTPIWGGIMRARRYRSARRRRSIAIVFGALLLAAGTLFAAAPFASAGLGFEVQSLDGSGNNLAHPEWGKAGTDYPRLLAARYADGHSALVNGPNIRTGEHTGTHLDAPVHWVTGQRSEDVS